MAAQAAAECTARLLDVLTQNGLDNRRLGIAVREFPRLIEMHIKEAMASVSGGDVGVYAIQDADDAPDQRFASDLLQA